MKRDHSDNHTFTFEDDDSSAHAVMLVSCMRLWNVRHCCRGDSVRGNPISGSEQKLFTRRVGDVHMMHAYLSLVMSVGVLLHHQVSVMRCSVGLAFFL